MSLPTNVGVVPVHVSGVTALVCASLLLCFCMLCVLAGRRPCGEAHASCSYNRATVIGMFLFSSLASPPLPPRKQTLSRNSKTSVLYGISFTEVESDAYWLYNCVRYLLKVDQCLRLVECPLYQSLFWQESHPSGEDLFARAQVSADGQFNCCFMYFRCVKEFNVRWWYFSSLQIQ
jgi:hypothetical protein